MTDSDVTAAARTQWSSDQSHRCDLLSKKTGVYLKYVHSDVGGRG